MRSAVTVSLVPEARGGPFVFWDDLEAACREARALGFEAVEVFPRAPDQLAPASLRECLDRHHLRLAAVGTGAGWVVHRLRLTDPDESTRARAREFAAGVIDWGAQLGAPAIIGSMQGRWEPGGSRAQALEWLRDALKELGGRATGHGVPLLFEPLNRYETNLVNCVDDGLELLQSLDRPGVLLLADLFHMNLEERELASAIRRAGSRLGHVHLADSNRQAAGLGHTDFPPVIAALRDIAYQGYLSAEILPLPDSATAARQTIQSIRSLLDQR